jgi:hypothetical protein
MASIYAKALVRKDYSGIVDKRDGEQGKEAGETMSTSNSTSKSSETGSNADKKSKSKSKSKSEDAKADEQNTSGADVGKIVQLMSGDADGISHMVSYAYFLYVSFLHSVYI